MLLRDRPGDQLDLGMNEPAGKVPAWLLGPDPKGFRPKRRYRTIWVSDVHLGTRGCNAVMLVDTDSLERRGNMVLVTVMTVAPPQRAGEWDRSVIRREIDCAGSRSCSTRATRFAGASAKKCPAQNRNTSSSAAEASSASVAPTLSPAKATA